MHNQIDPDTTGRPLIDIDQAASIVKLKRSTLYALTSRRKIPHYKRGGKLYFDSSELMDWLRKGRRDVIDVTSAERHLSGKSGRQQ